MALKSWLNAHRHESWLRHSLAATQRVYAFARDRSGKADLPAIAGGWPMRCVPQPAPRPISRREVGEVRRAFRGQSTSFFDGEAVHELETLLAQRFGTRHALACSSGTAALHTALMAVGVGPGDEVIVPALTYVATALAALHTSAEVRLAEPDPRTWNIDPGSIRAAITPRTKAIIPVHMGGVACDMDAIMAIAQERDLFVIEDAAHAHGATWRGRALGSIGHLGCFSFGSPKTITTGEGGAILTDDPELARQARIAMNLGECTPEGVPSMELEDFRPEERLDYVRVGWNYRMSVAQAALGVGQLKRFDGIRDARARAGRIYRERLAEIPGVRVQDVALEADPVYYTFPIEVEEGASLTRNELLRGLERERIDYRLWSNLPLNRYPIFGDHGEFPIANRLCLSMIGLRTDPALGPREHHEVADALARLLRWGATRT